VVRLKWARIQSPRAKKVEAFGAQALLEGELSAISALQTIYNTGKRTNKIQQNTLILVSFLS
jgi:hypothetical protein